MDLIGRMPSFLPGKLGWWWNRRLLFYFSGRPIISFFMHIFLSSPLGNWVGGEVEDFYFVKVPEVHSKGKKLWDWPMAKSFIESKFRGPDCTMVRSVSRIGNSLVW